MAVYDLEEQEQLAELKAWWSAHGTIVLAVVTAAAVAFAGWALWRNYSAGQSTKASALYESTIKAAQAGDAKAMRDSTGALATAPVDWSFCTIPRPLAELGPVAGDCLVPGSESLEPIASARGAAVVPLRPRNSRRSAVWASTGSLSAQNATLSANCGSN